MGFFASFWTWLNGQLADYIGTNTARVAEALEPAIVTLATVYLMVWGYLQLTGRIDEPLGAGLKRLVTLAVVLGGALHLWLYNTIIVDTFYRAPTELAAPLLQAVESFAAQTAGRGIAITTVDALNMVLIAMLVFLLMRQVMPIAAALAGGVALSSFGTVSRLVNFGLHQGTRATVGAAALTTGVFSNLVARRRRSEKSETTVARTF